jgi:predicted Zn-dependent protease with MMP-like domain
MPQERETLERWAAEEIDGVLGGLPGPVRAAAEQVAVSFEDRPGREPGDSGLVGDELGLFEGSDAFEEPDPADLPRIRLFLANLWDFSECDEGIFREEARITFLHELGHYLGWNEEDLAERELD